MTLTLRLCELHVSQLEELEAAIVRCGGHIEISLLLELVCNMFICLKPREHARDHEHRELAPKHSGGLALLREPGQFSLAESQRHERVSGQQNDDDFWKISRKMFQSVEENVAKVSSRAEQLEPISHTKMIKPK